MKSFILNGSLPLPSADKFEEALLQKEFNLLKQFWGALWHSYLTGKNPINSTYWYDRFKSINGVKAFNISILSLSRGGWVNSSAVPARNWAECSLVEDKLLEVVTAEELEAVRATYKVALYSPTFSASTETSTVKVNGVKKATGLVREGFALAGNTQYGFDTSTLSRNKKAIVAEAVKGMAKLRENYPLPVSAADYDEVVKAVIDNIEDSPETLYTLGSNTSDSRGRAISSSLKSVGNPIGFKEFRALLVVTYE